MDLGCLRANLKGNYRRNLGTELGLLLQEVALSESGVEAQISWHGTDGIPVPDERATLALYVALVLFGVAGASLGGRRDDVFNYLLLVLDASVLQALDDGGCEEGRPVLLDEVLSVVIEEFVVPLGAVGVDKGAGSQ